MKRIFSILAAALVLFGAVSCKNKKDEPSAPKFTITVTDIMPTAALANVTPSDNTKEYLVSWAKAEQVDGYATPKAFAETLVNTYKAMYQNYAFLKTAQIIKSGKGEQPMTNLTPNTVYKVVISEIKDEDLTIGEVATFTFTTEPWFTITVTDVTATKATINVVPFDNTMEYLVSWAKAEQVDGYATPKLFAETLVNTYKAMYQNYAFLKTAHIIKSGKGEQQVPNLTPNTVYKVVISEIKDEDLTIGEVETATFTTLAE